MTFEEWWKDNGVYQSYDYALIEEAAKEAWYAAKADNDKGGFDSDGFAKLQARIAAANKKRVGV